MERIDPRICEEQEALLAICGHHMEVLESGKLWCLRLSEESEDLGTSNAATIVVHLPPGYPDQSAPDILAIKDVHESLNEIDLDEALAGLDGIWSPGQVCVFDLKLHIRDFLNERIFTRSADKQRGAVSNDPEVLKFLPPIVDLAGPPQDIIQKALTSSQTTTLWHESLFRRGKYGERHLLATLNSNSPLFSWSSEACVNIKTNSGSSSEVNILSRECAGNNQEARKMQIFHSEPFTEMKSTFQAHIVSGLSAMEEIHQVLLHLYHDKHFDAATHNIWAYRMWTQPSKTGNRGAILNSDYDDDGEAMAGKKLAELLELAKCENILVVVSRWFGGTLMGPARFKAFNRSAQQLMDQLGLRNAGVQAKRHVNTMQVQRM